MFETALRESVMSARRQLERAYLDAQPSQVHRHAARLLDLLDRARANGIDTSGWVPATLMAVVMTSAADTV
jgi:post-segregation antitoxin (ccd killing protein)